MKKNPMGSAFLITVVLSGFALAGFSRFGIVQAAVVIGIITSDTTWTKANSPYNLTGPLAVANGVTLVIEPGVTVNLGPYYVQVNGTLHAQGSYTDKVVFTSTATSDLFQIEFTRISSSWSEQTGSGSIMENAIINASISIDGVSPKISNNFITDITASMTDSNTGISINGGSPVVSNNHIIGGSSVGGDGSSAVSNNIITGGMGIYSGSHVISNNEISGGSSYFFIGRDWDRDYDVVAIGGGSSVIAGNRITGNSLGIGFYEGAQVNATISDTIIYGCGTGIALRRGAITIHGNLLMNNGHGIIISTNVLQPIEGNLVINNTRGIQISSNAQVTIRKNSIINNPMGISTDSYLVTIANNNIQNDDYNVQLQQGTSNDVDVTNNWWGKTNTQLINQSMFDNKNDFNLDKLNFIPFLTAPNPDAPAITMIPSPAPNPSPSPAQSPDQNPSPTPSPSTSPSPNSTTTEPTEQTDNQAASEVGLLEIAVATLIVIVAALSIIIVGMHKRSRTEKKNIA